MRGLRLLSVDWDSFFPTPQPDDSEYHHQWGFYDWAHAESAFLLGTTVWSIRAMTFFKAGLPLPGLNGRQNDFWQRADIAGAQVFVAESHSTIGDMRVLDGIEDIVSYDAHHDCGYRPNPLERIVAERNISCEDWAVYAASQISGEIVVVYPEWRANAMVTEIPTYPQGVRRVVDDGRHLGRFDRLFICRSGAWVPPWCDQEFFRFTSRTVAEFGAASITAADIIEPREFSEELSRQMAEAEERALKWLKENDTPPSNL